MKVYPASIGSQDMDVADYSIGLHKDEAGRPLLIVDGKVLGPIEEVRALLDRYDLCVNERSKADVITVIEAHLARFSAELESVIQRAIARRSRAV